MCPAAHRTPMKNQCHCEASANTGRGNPYPRPHGPLPKGGWHGEAVPGGFLTASHSL